MTIFTASTSARFDVIEFVEELEQELIERTARERYEEIKAKYDADVLGAFYNLPSEEFWFMENYEEEHLRGE